MGFFSSIGHAVTHPRQTFNAVAHHSGGFIPGGLPFSGGIPGPLGALGGVAGGGGIPGLEQVQALASAVPSLLKGVQGVTNALGMQAASDRELRQHVKMAVDMQRTASHQIGQLAQSEKNLLHLTGLQTKLIAGSFKLIGKEMGDTNRLRKTLAQDFTGLHRTGQRTNAILMDLDANMVTSTWVAVAGVAVAVVALVTRGRGTVL